MSKKVFLNQTVLEIVNYKFLKNKILWQNVRKKSKNFENQISETSLGQKWVGIRKQIFELGLAKVG